MSDNDDMQEPTSGVDAESDAPGAGGDSELVALRKERDELYQRLARVTADFQNTLRRSQAEFDRSLAYANERLIKVLLPVIDNFERALAIDPTKADSASILKGLQVVHDQWLSVLKQQSVEAIAPEPGTPFDPQEHEALMQQPDDRYSETTVTALLQKGYKLHGRTLRPAQVAVSA